jgi:hypothetical protein
MPIFGSAGKEKKDTKPKKDNKPKKLPDTAMDKVAGGQKDSGQPKPTSDGQT